MQLSNVDSRIREARARAGLTQNDVSLALGVTIGTVQAWEYGRAQLTLRRAAELSELYGVTIDWIAFGTDLPRIEDPRLTKIKRLLNDETPGQ